MRQHRARILAYTAIILVALASALPSVLPSKALESLPPWYSANRITLGLDLRGGSHLLLAVDTAKLVSDATEQFAHSLTAALDAEQLRYGAVKSNGREVSLHVREPTAREAAARLARELALEEGPGAYTVALRGSELVLKYGLSLVLVVIGIKMILNAWAGRPVIPTEIALLTTAVLIGGSVLFSMWKTRGMSPEEAAAEAQRWWVPGSPPKPRPPQDRQGSRPDD